MIVKLGIPGFVLLLGAGFALSQATGDKQQEFAAHMQKARSYLDARQPALAIPEFQAAVAIDPENVDAQANLGVLLFFQGKAADSIPHFRAALAARKEERQPGLAKIQGLLGMAESRTLDFANARKDMEAAFPSLQELRFQVQLGLELVGLYAQSGDLEKAAALLGQLKKAQYRKAIAIDPHLPGVHFELAELLHTSTGEAVKKEAEQEYHAALLENTQDEKSILRLAEIDAQRGNIEQSYKGYTKAVDLQPADTDARLGLAKTLTAMNQTGKALALLEDTVKLEPTNATAHYRLATLYRQVGRVDDARRELELYQKFNEMKEKLRALYKELQVQPKEIRADEPDQP